MTKKYYTCINSKASVWQQKMNAQRMRWIKLLEYVYIMLKLYPNETNSIVMMACLQMVFIKF